MRMSETGLSLIRHFEGFSATPYRCPAGYLTIGYGHVLAPGEDFQLIDHAKAGHLLQQDVKQAEQAVAALIEVALRPHQFDALVSFTFNLGSGALQRSTLRRVVNRGEHDEVPAQLQRWVFAGGRRLPGLVCRRHAESRLYQGFSPL